jgi:hypothetical protein
MQKIGQGSKILTISFAQAGVSSSQVKAGSGKSHGGSVNGTINGTGVGYDPDPNGDIWAGYAHHVGLKYMKIGKKSSGNWDENITKFRLTMSKK